MTDYYGDYEYYLEKKAQTAGEPAAGARPLRSSVSESPQAEIAKTVARSADPAPLPPVTKEERLRDREEQKRRKREDDKRQKRLGEVEQEIARTEKAVAKLEEEMNAPGFFDDPERGAVAGEQHAELNLRLEALYGEWEELSG